MKQTKIRHEPKTRYKKPIDINKQIDEFYKTIKKHKLNDIISIDETSLNAYEVRKHCYETIGKRCVIKTHSQEVFKKYTGIFAISTKGVIGYDTFPINIYNNINNIISKAKDIINNKKELEDIWKLLPYNK